MQLSTKGRYAVMAMVDLATRETTDHPNDLSCLADIADRQQLSQSYLEQLFGKLRRAGLVRATRCEIGGGGCMIAPRPYPGAAACGEKCQTHDLWAELGRQIALFLRGVTLADVVLGRVAGRATGLPPLEAVLPVGAVSDD
jgi:Rrf2 family iron-sulfur cluster assembly transcriptional regulator